MPVSRRIVADALAAVAPEHRPSVVLGFDGFIDDIVDLVAERRSAADYDRIGTIGHLAKRLAAAAGHSCNIERVVRLTKIGGNGPIMAAALMRLRAQVDYIGALGDSCVHAVFSELAEGARSCISLGAPSHTEALEFDDGKVMLGNLEPMDAITWDRLIECVGLERLGELLGRADGIATVNWTMTFGMTEIWEQLAEQVLPKLSLQDRPLWFIDLADPAKRSKGAILRAMQVLQKLQQHVDVVLGLNEAEAHQILGLLDNDAAERLIPIVNEGERCHAMAVAIRSHLPLFRLALHFTGHAASAWADGSASEPGFYISKPKITTGAGDHFNAGYFAACLAGLDQSQALVVGTATSGFYVRNAKSPTRQDLVDFMRAEADAVTAAPS
ncbi:MAG: carbohydrate kinase family protein [Planctomycetota bacterium]